jgi:hypothetical protein
MLNHLDSPCHLLFKPLPSLPSGGLVYPYCLTVRTRDVGGMLSWLVIAREKYLVRGQELFFCLLPTQGLIVSLAS